MLFDKGFYTLKEKPDFNKSIKFHIDGIRLKGDFALIHFKDDIFERHQLQIIQVIEIF